MDQQPEPPDRRSIVDAFHRAYYESADSWPRNTFLGYPIEQCPLDPQLYQEMAGRLPPPFILQAGVRYGGSILYFAMLLDMIGADAGAPVIGIDIAMTDAARTLTHPRIRLLEGSSTAPEVVERARALLPPARGLVV